MPTIKREFVRKGTKVGAVEFVAPDGDYMVNGQTLPESSVTHLLTFALQTLQDAYAGAKDESEAKGAFDGKLDKLLAGSIGTRGVAAGRPAWWGEVVKIIRPAVKDRDPDAYKNADAATINKWIAEAYDGLSAAKRDAVDATARKRHEIAERAKREAAEAADDIDIEL